MWRHRNGSERCSCLQIRRWARAFRGAPMQRIIASAAHERGDPGANLQYNPSGVSRSLVSAGDRPMFCAKKQDRAKRGIVNREREVAPGLTAGQFWHCAVLVGNAAGSRPELIQSMDVSNAICRIVVRLASKHGNVGGSVEEP